MADSFDSKIDEVVKTLKNIDKNITDFSNILQKFGLDIITKIGKSTQNLKVLTDKVDQFHSTIIDIKGLVPLLNKIVENQDVFESELELIKSLIQRSKVSTNHNDAKNQGDEVKASKTEKMDNILNELDQLNERITELNDVDSVVKELESFKQNFFELTGGHKILYEISKEIKKLKNEDILTDALKNYLSDKITDWIKNL